jgi:hypothetical protein
MRIFASWLGVGVGVIVLWLSVVSTLPAVAQAPSWSAPFRLSLDGTSWFPDIAADAAGHVHVIWSSLTLDYRRWDGRGWSPISDIAVALDAQGAPIDDVFRASIASDRFGYLNLFYYHLSEGLGYFRRAPLASAGLAKSWSVPKVIGASGTGYYSMVGVDQRNWIHAVYIDVPAGSRVADIFYRRSENEGESWTLPINLSNSLRLGSSRPQLLVDQFDTLHVSWDEGWDRRSGEGTAQVSRYVFSINGGREWSPPITFGSANLPAAQLVVTSGPTIEQRVAVWRTVTDEAVYYQISSDGGQTWSSPTPIPGILPRLWNSPPFDQYTLVRDDGGIVHLVLVTRRPQNEELWAVTHIEWNGQAWGKPETIFERSGLYPEYPRATIALGNQLHVVWFTRAALFTSAPMDVWHSMRMLNFPAYTPAPSVPTVTRVVATPTPRPIYTPTRFATPIAIPASTPTSLDTGALLPLAIGIGAGTLAIMLGLLVRYLNKQRD